MPDNTATNKEHNFTRLVPRTPLRLIVPNVERAGSEFRSEMQKITGSVPCKATPKKQISSKENDNDTVFGTTPGGSELIDSPSKNLTITITTPSGKHVSEERLRLLVRKQDYKKSAPSPVLNDISKALFSPEEEFSIIATHKTRQSQPKRKTQKRERDAVGNSAANIVVNFLEEAGATFPRETVTAEKWELCHLLSYAIAKNGVDANGKPFNTQVAKNLFAGTRVLNENMMRIENVLLELLNENAVRSITYSAEPFVLNDAHILSQLNLKVCITTHEGSQIEFDMHYDALTESRKLPTEASTCMYAFFKSITANNKQDSLKSTVPSSGASLP